MASKEYSAEQQMLSNKHLKEWNDNIASEKEALYQLQSRQGIERDELVVEKITDQEQHSSLTHQQREAADKLKNQNSERRLAIQKRHLNEDDSLRQKLATITSSGEGEKKKRSN